MAKESNDFWKDAPAVKAAVYFYAALALVVCVMLALTSDSLLWRMTSIPLTILGWEWGRSKFIQAVKWIGRIRIHFNFNVLLAEAVEQQTV